ncbi:type II toxin-antitoxin system RelE/ParE family toxin [Methyloprofundus sp.]|uniref:type II toxin-antitoxin system RelE/ParE family toxin n=1 Tax=Methyloprofundus sp. TaxID=2020875 RepID=UPI003D1101A1
MKLSYSPESINDLIRLREFIEMKNPQAAKRIAKSLRKGINELKSFPYMGVKVEKAPKPDLVRDLIIGSYTARYLIRLKEITILRLWHHKEKENRL